MVRRIALVVPLIVAGLAAGVASSAPGAGSARDNPALRAVEANQALREHDLEDAQASADAARGEIAQLEAQLNELSAAQASGGDLTAADWAMIDQAAAANLLKLKGYANLTSALLQAPSAPPPAAPIAPAAPALADE